VDPVPDPLLLRKSGSAGDRTRDLCICSQKLWPLDHRGGLTSIDNIQDSMTWSRMKLGWILFVSLGVQGMKYILDLVKAIVGPTCTGTSSRNWAIQVYSKWLSEYSFPARIPHQIRETTTIRQFHSKMVCTVSRERVWVYPGTEGTNQNCHWNHHHWYGQWTRLSCWCL